MRERDLSAQSKQYSSRDLPSHTRLKYRQDGQGTADEARGTTARDFKRDLEDRERRHKGSSASDDQPSATGTSSKRARLTDSSGASASGSGAAAVTAAVLPPNLDADDQAVAVADLDSDAESAGGGDDEEDETAELMAELAKIRKERAAENAKREAERQAEEERIRTENILKGNPLLNKSKPQTARASASGASASSSSAGEARGGEFKVKRRWNDDVVFKNCARDEDGGRERRPVGFVNDTLRSEFHKKFMDKYIK